MTESPKPTILFIDDEPEFIDAFRPALRKEYYVVEAHSPQDGLDAARKFRPDIILLDIRMPDYEMDGLEVLARLKAGKDTRNTNEASFVVEALRLGARDYLVKSAVANNLNDLRARLRATYEQVIVPQQRESIEPVAIAQPADPKARRIFISYASEDREFANIIKAEIDRQPGYEGWIDHATMKGTQFWLKAIEEGLETCAGMVLILSPEAVDSYWVTAEFLSIIRMRKPLIPVLYKDCDVPLVLEPINRIDYVRNPLVSDIIDAVRLRVS